MSEGAVLAEVSTGFAATVWAGVIVFIGTFFNLIF